MPQSDGQPPQQKRTTKPKKNDLTPITYQEPYRRNAHIDEEDMSTEDDVVVNPPRPSTTAIRRTGAVPTPRTTAGQNSPIPQRRVGPPQPTTSFPIPVPPQAYLRSPARQLPPPAHSDEQKKKVHWLLPVGIGMIAMLVLWVLGSSLVAWWSVKYDDLRYGNPRTFQTDAVVGHGGDNPQHPSHFIAVNLNRQAIVVEFMAGSPAKSISYVVPYYILGQGGDLTPITLEFRDVTGHGKLDMIVHIQLHPQDQTFVFVNDGTKFRPPTSSDNIHL